MTFKSLQENLRKRLLEDIHRGDLTGVSLAERSGLQQAHISNFLNSRRGLSLEAMDRVLAANKLSIFDLLDARELDAHASIAQSPEAEFVNVPLLGSCAAASEPRIMRAVVYELLKYRGAFLNHLRPDCEKGRMKWERFVAMRAQAAEGMSMFPRLLPGATVLIDRHYDALQPYHRGELNIYLVRKPEGDCSIRYIEASAGRFILRPHNPAYPVEVLPARSQREVTEHILGRIAHIGLET